MDIKKFIDLEYRAKGLNDILNGAGKVSEKVEQTAQLVQDLNETIDEMGKSGVKASKIFTESIKAGLDYLEKHNKRVYNIITKSRENAEKESNAKIIQGLEKQLDTTRKKWQEMYRSMAKSKNELLNGKKNTPAEINYIDKQMKNYEKEIKRIKKELSSVAGNDSGLQKQINNIFKHDNDAKDFTIKNAQQRAARDYLNQTQKDYTRLVELEKQLEAEYGKEAASTQEAKRQKEELAKTREKEINLLAKEAKTLATENGNSKKYYSDVLNNIVEKKRQSNNSASLKNLISNDAEGKKEVLSLAKQIYAVEDKITKLSTNSRGKISEIAKNQHRNEIAALENEKRALESQTKEVEKKYNLQGKVKQKQEEITQEENKSRLALEARNKDLQNQHKLLSETLTNFAKFTIYYQSLRLLRQGVQQAIDTMKDLDKAMTDVRLVTGGSVEDTAKLAKEYNQLAKEMGSTTTAVAEGAGEWFNESRDHLKVLELLETRED